MSRRRWIADEVSGNRAYLVGEHARHLGKVLRAEVGQEFEISLGTEVRQARISSIRSDRVEFELGAAVLSHCLCPVTVATSIFKFDRMDWAIEKCTELGVSRILPIISARSDPYLARSAAKRVERWRRIAAQASEQSRRISPPEIPSPIKFEELLLDAAEHRIVLAESTAKSMLKDVLSTPTSSIILAFGPEGGWKAQELESFRKAGWTLASLGPAILRVETAIVAAVALARALVAPVRG